MSEQHNPNPHESRADELILEVLRNRLLKERMYDRNIQSDLARLKDHDPIAGEIVRYLSERYFPGRLDIVQKEKAVRMLATAFLVREDMEGLLKNFDIDRFLTELDKFDHLESPEPPDPAENQ